eukprot:gene30926-35981_t
MPEHQYTDWVRAYASAELQDLAAQLEALVDKYASNSDRTLVADTYRYAMECERDFFAAAWLTQLCLSDDDEEEEKEDDEDE